MKSIDLISGGNALGGVAIESKKIYLRFSRQKVIKCEPLVLALEKFTTIMKLLAPRNSDCGILSDEYTPFHSKGNLERMLSM